MEKIIVDRGVASQIARTLKVSKMTVRSALGGILTIKYNEIRELAIKLGGIRI